MADVTSRLRLVVDSSGLDRSGRKLRKFRRETRRADDQARRLKSAFAGLAGVIGAAFSVRQLTKFGDELTSISNRLRLVTGSQLELNRTFEALGVIARNSQSSLETTVTLFSRVEQFAGEAFKSQQQALDFTEAIQKAFLAAGASAQEASNAVRQLTQGLASGELRGEEFRSVSEQAPLLARAITDAIGDGTKSAFELAKEGAFTTERVVSAVLGRLEEFREEASKVAPTIGRSFEVLRTQILLTFGASIQKATEQVSRLILSFSDNLETIIPLIQGVGVALLVALAPATLSGIGIALAAIVSPLGLIAAGIAAVVAFRDDLARFVLGVEDFDEAVQSAFNTERAEAFRESLRKTIEFLMRGLEGLANAFYEVRDVLIEIGAITPVVSLDKELDTYEKIRQQLLNINKERAQLEQRLNLEGERRIVFNPILEGTKQFDAAIKRLEELKRLENELLAIQTNSVTQVSESAALATVNIESIGEALETKVIERTKSATEEVGRLTKAYKELKDEAQDASNDILNGLQDQLNAFLGDAERIDLFSAPNARTAANVLREQLEGVIRDLEDASIGLNPDQLQALQTTFDEARQQLGKTIEQSLEDGAESVRQSIEFAFGDALDALIFEGGKGFAQQFNRLIRGAANDNFIDPISKALTGKGSITENITGAFEKQLAGFQKAFGNTLGSIASSAFSGFQGFEIGKGLSNLLGVRGNKASQIAGGIIGGGVGATAGSIAGLVVGPVGAAIGAAIGAALGNVIGGLASKPSNRTAQGVFNPFTGDIAGLADDKAPENAAVRDQLIKGINQFTDTLRDVLGVTGISNTPGTPANEAFLNVAVRSSRKNGKSFIEVGFQGPGGEPIGGSTFEATELGAAEAVDEAVRLAISAFRGGENELLDIAKALADADFGAADIIDTVNQIANLTELGAEPLSEYQQRIKDLNDVFDDALRKVEGVTEAEKKLTDAREKAIQAVTRDFDRDIQEQISQRLDGPLDQLEKLLKTQEERFEEAQQLGADLAQVERLAALELREFFRGLNDDALKEVESFLGLFEEATNSVARNLDLSRQDLQTRRDSFQRFAEQFASLSTQFNERFVAASPRESIGILRGRANELLGQVREGNESAASALPQVLNQLVENARQTFGNTQGFTDVFNFVQETLRSAEQASLDIVSDTERQIMALDESNVLLADIRDILASSQAANAFFQSYSSGGVASADELLALIQSGAGLTPAANDNAAALNITGLIAQSVTPIVMPIANSIDTFTQRLFDLPDLQRLHIDATEKSADKIVEALGDVSDRLDRIEVLEQQQLKELENAA